MSISQIEANKATIRKLVDAHNQQDACAAAALWQSAATNHGRVAGSTGMERVYRSLYATFPDFRWEIEAIFGDGDCDADRGRDPAPKQTYAMWAEATEAIQKFGTMVKSPTGYPQQSPYASRSRIPAPPADERDLFNMLKSEQQRPTDDDLH